MGFVLAGITAPRRTATVGPVQPGRIAQVAADEGQRVREGELLVRLIDDAQRVRTEIARARAESSLDVEIAKARMEYARHELDDLMHLIGDDFAAPKEVRCLEHRIVKFQFEQAKREYEREKALLEQLRIRAPFDGYVTRVLKHRGETVNEREGVITVVQLDPLEVLIDCPLEMAHMVRVGDQVPIRAVDGGWGDRTGKVVFQSRVADAASQTFRVKLRLGNEDAGWISGLKVYVDFSEAQ